MAPRMTHICLHVEDLERCVAFYRRYCGLQVVADRSTDGEGSIYLASPGEDAGPVFQLMSGGRARPQAESDNRHLGFAVESREAVDEIARQGRADGCLFWEAAEHIPGAYLCGVIDPDGNCVEFSFGHAVPPP